LRRSHLLSSECSNFGLFSCLLPWSLSPIKDLLSSKFKACHADRTFWNFRVNEVDFNNHYILTNAWKWKMSVNFSSRLREDLIFSICSLQQKPSSTERIKAHHDFPSWINLVLMVFCPIFDKSALYFQSFDITINWNLIVRCVQRLQWIGYLC
jgi:hypothetical protein